MRSLRRALIGLAALGFGAGAVPLALAIANEGGHQRELIAITGPLIGWAFIGTGIYAWLREPENRFGALMTAVGFSACLAGLRVSTEPWVFVVGLLFITWQWALLYHMLLAFPGGALRSRREVVLVVEPACGRGTSGFFSASLRPGVSASGAAVPLSVYSVSKPGEGPGGTTEPCYFVEPLARSRRLRPLRAPARSARRRLGRAAS